MRYKYSKGRIEKYFPPAHTPEVTEAASRVSICDLPLNILRSILAYSGLFTWDTPIDLNLIHDVYFLSYPSLYRHSQEDLKEPKPTEPCFYQSWAFDHDDYVDYEGLGPDEPAAHPNLVDKLMISRSLSEAARDLLYGSNEFVIRRSGPRGFTPILKLGARDAASLQSLHVHLDVPHTIPACQCHCSSCYPLCWSKPLSHACNKGKCVCASKVLLDWAQVCAYLENTIHPKRLKLSLDCEVALKSGQVDFELAERVLAPLYRLPLLAQCSIRLTRQKNQRLKDMAQEAVNRLMGRITPTFPFSRLPVDLRYHILTMTDLVAPHSLVWTSHVPKHIYGCWRKYGHFEPEWRNIPLSYPYNKRRHPARDQDYCGPIWDTSPEEDYSWDLGHEDPRWERLPECAHCDIKTGTGFTSQCQLWHFPAELFRVNREMSEFAHRIFFIHNRFILPSFCHVVNTAWGITPYIVAFAGQFGEELCMPGPFRPNTRQYIQNLEIVFRLNRNNSGKSSEFVAQPEWENLVYLLEHGDHGRDFNVRMLSLKIVIGFHGKIPPLPHTLGWRHQAWRDIISPFSRIRNLRSFKVTVFETFEKQFPRILHEVAAPFEIELESIWSQGLVGFAENLSLDGYGASDSLAQNVCPRKWWWFQDPNRSYRYEEYDYPTNYVV